MTAGGHGFDGVERRGLMFVLSSPSGAGKTTLSRLLIERMPGLDFYLDPSIVKSADTERVRSVLLGALSSLDKRQVKPAV